MSTSDKRTTDSPEDRTKITNAGTPPSLRDEPDEESADLDDWPQERDDDDEILDVLIAEDMI